MNKPNWIIHFIQEHDCEYCGKHESKETHVGFTGFMNAHTHGFISNGHDEMCICFDIGPQIAGMILNNIGIRIRKLGHKFEEGKDSTVLEGGYDVEFYRSNDSKTLYMLLPDPNNKFPGDKDCQFPYNQQRLFADIIEEEKGYV